MSYMIQVETESPSTAEVDKEITIIFKFKNISNRRFPGANNLLIRMIWANIDPKNISVNRPVSLPAIEVNETHKEEFKETLRIDGTLLFYFFNNNVGEYQAIDTQEVELYNKQSRFKVNNIFHAIRVQSKEEKYQYWANIIAAGSLLILIIIEVIKRIFP